MTIRTISRQSNAAALLIVVVVVVDKSSVVGFVIINVFVVREDVVNVKMKRE